MTYDWLLLNPPGNQGSQRRSQNNLRGVYNGDKGPKWTMWATSLLFLSSSCMVGFDSQLEYEPRVSSLLKLELEGLVLQQAYQSFSWTKTSASFGDWVRYLTLRAKVKV